MTNAPEHCGCQAVNTSDGISDDKCQFPALKAELEWTKKALKEYEGWSPKQFMGLMEEHRSLQKRYVELDTEKCALQKRVERFEFEALQYRNRAVDAEKLATERLSWLEEHARRIGLLTDERDALQKRVTELVADKQKLLDFRLAYMNELTEQQAEIKRNYEIVTAQNEQIADQQVEIQRLKAANAYLGIPGNVSKTLDEVFKNGERHAEKRIKEQEAWIARLTKRLQDLGERV